MDTIPENKIRWYVMQVMSGKEDKVFAFMHFICSKDPSNVVEVFRLEETKSEVAKASKFKKPTKTKEAKAYRVVLNGLVKGIYELTIPYERIEERKQGKKTVTNKKVYPGYILIKMALYDGNDRVIPENWMFLREVNGAIGLIGGQNPVPLSEEEVKEMTRRQQQNLETQAKPKVEYNVGEKVVIREGAFMDNEAVIDAIDQEKSRLRLSVNIFGRYTPLEVEFWQVERP